jgi:hypothetical protein
VLRKPYSCLLQDTWGHPSCPLYCRVHILSLACSHIMEPFTIYAVP